MSNTDEEKIRACWEKGDRDGATTLALSAYGPEIMGLFLKLLGDESSACDVFSIWSEDLWRGIEKFEWRASLRTWSYRLARNAIHRYRRDPYRNRARALRSRELSGLEQQTRTITQAYVKTEIKDRFRQLRAQLTDEQNILLVLHIDRAMSWKDIALVLHEGAPETLEVSRETNRLRQKFHRVTEKLRRLATQQGLLAEHQT